MPRNDGRTRGKSVFGKPNKTYDKNSPKHPEIIEERTANQETPIKAVFTPHDRVASALLISQVSEKGDNTDAVITEDYKTLPGPLLVGAEMNEECQGAVASTGIQELKNTDAEYVPDFGTIAYSDTPIDSNRKMRRITYAEHGFPVLTEIYYQMEKNGRKVTKLYEYVPTTSTPGTPSPGVTYEYRRYNVHRWLQITTIWDTVTSYSEYDDAAYPFPMLFQPDSFYAWSDACGAFSNLQGRREILTQVRTDHIWSTTPPPTTPTGFFILRPITHLAGRGWQVSEPTINNRFPFTYSGGCTAEYIFEASTPDYDTYASLVQDLGGSGTPQLVSARVTLDEDLRWHYANRLLQMQ